MEERLHGKKYERERELLKIFRTGTVCDNGTFFAQTAKFYSLASVGKALAYFRREGGSAVKDELNFEILLCDDYEKLLTECQHELEHWNDRSEAIREQQQTGEAAGRELLRLQARFAKSYTVLQRHTERCERCQLVSRMNHSLTDATAHALASVAN